MSSVVVPVVVVVVVVVVAAITEACNEVVDAGLLASLLKLLSTTFDIKKEVCYTVQLFSS